MRYLITVVITILCLGCGGVEVEGEPIEGAGVNEPAKRGDEGNCVPSELESDCADADTYCQEQAMGPGQPNLCMMCYPGSFNCDGNDLNGCESESPCT